MQLIPLTGVDRDPIYVRIPLGAMPFLIAGSEWTDGHLSGWGSHGVADVEVHVGTFASEVGAAIPFKLFDPSDYFLHRMPAPCYARVFRTEAGPELVVPTWEILRTWYLFHPRVVSAFVGGGFRFPDSVATSLLPWRPEYTRWPVGDIPHVVRRKYVSDHVALRFARFLFDPMAGERAYYIRRSLQHGQSIKGAVSWVVPPVLPPYEGVARWTIWYRDIRATERHPARRLVLRICAADVPLPYEDISLVSEADNTPGENHDDPNLPLSWTGGKPAHVLAEDGSVELTGEGADGALASLELDSFGFADNALHVRAHRPAKLLQTHRHGGGRPETVAVTQVSMDPTAASQPGHAAQGDEGIELVPDATRLPSMVSVVAMQEVFGAVIEQINGPLSRFPAGWSARFYMEGGRCFSVRNAKRGERRRFLAVEISDGDRFIYMIEAERLVPSDNYAIFVCEDRHGQSLTDPILGAWLQGFPYKHGSHWLPDTYGIVDLIATRAKHQAHLKGHTEETWFALFVKRLQGKILDFAERRYPQGRWEARGDCEDEG